MGRGNVHVPTSTASADKDGLNSESSIPVERKGNSSNRNLSEVHNEVNNINSIEDGANGDEDIPPQTRNKAPSGQRKLYSDGKG